MQPMSRIGDIGVGACLGHKKKPKGFLTIFCTGATTTLVDGIPVTTVATIGVASCGHVTIACTGSSLTTATNGLPIHRVGDIGVPSGGGIYSSCTGAPTTLTD